jgi:3-phosphoshikimate 1-carboxyvinyltransferase
MSNSNYHFNHQAKPLASVKNHQPLKGKVNVPGDKSISHRALIFACLAHGKSKISGLLEGEDVLKTAKALTKMGAEINKLDDGSWQINGSGIAGLMESDNVLDMGNSGTSTRLLAGLVAPYDFTSFFNGDDSLTKRPMQRIFEPIKMIGAKIIGRQNNFLPFAIIGAKNPLPISYFMKMASAQVKSAILLASLTINGRSSIIEPEKCRNHTEIMMNYLGLKLRVEDIEIAGKIGSKISYQGMQEFDAKDFFVPGDISSAAFLIVAAILIKDSKIKINNVGLNNLRDGIVTTLIAMGANIAIENERILAGEKVADIIVEYSKLKAVEVPASRAPIMIDEYPILAIAASFADGITKMNGLAELKVKESNRLLMIATNLQKCGVKVKIGDDYLEIKGGFKQPAKPVDILTNLDHRIAMSFLIMGMNLEKGVKIDDSSMIDTSFPDFVKIFKKLGAEFS